MVVAIEKREHGTQILVVPVSTRPPHQGDTAIEIPLRVKEHLGLGQERCWIVTDEYNLFTWPGPDIRPIRSGGAIEPRYGSIPGKLFEQVRAKIEIGRPCGAPQGNQADPIIAATAAKRLERRGFAWV